MLCLAISFANTSHMKALSTDYFAAKERMELYCIAHPRGPAAVRRPQLTKKGNRWIALLGENIDEGIVGFGPTIEAALCAFDVQYLNALRPPIAA
jgi:hypothetical protein